MTIGNNVQVTNDVSIHTHGGGNCIRKDHPDFDTFGKVIIEDWAYIGSFSQIMPGVTIGEGALVAAGSVGVIVRNHFMSSEMVSRGRNTPQAQLQVAP